MFGWFKTTDRIFWISALLLSVFIVTPARADGTFTLTPLQDPNSITVTGPEGTHVAPNIFPLFVNDTLTENLAAGLVCSGTNSGGQECTIDTKTFSYNNVVITYSPDGIQAFKPGTGSASIGSLDATTGNATLSASFPSAGYYKITYGVHVDYTSATCHDGSQDGSGNLSFAVQAGDFDFYLDPGLVVLAPGGSVTLNAIITSYNNFNNSVSFSSPGENILPGLLVSGSETPPPNGSISARISVSIGKSIPFTTSNVTYPVDVRGQAQVGSVLLAHDHNLSVIVNFVYITGPYDGSKSKAGPNTRNADGSITTDSVLSLQTSPLVYDPWRATSALVAVNTAGLSLSYDWSADYGVTSFGMFSSDHASYQVNQSDSPDANGPFRATTATATNTPYGSNSYTIRWHHQYEGWTKDNTKTPVTYNKIIIPKSVPGLPLVGCGTGGVNATYQVYNIDVEGLTSSGKLVAAGAAGAVAFNPIYAGLLGIMAIKLDDLNAAIKGATTTPRSVTGLNAFTAGLDQKGDIPTFYEDRNGQSINMKRVFNIDKTSPYAAILDRANSFTMKSTSLSVQYQQTYFIADEYGAQGYVGAHSDYVYVFNSGNPVVDCGVFQLSQNAPSGT